MFVPVPMQQVFLTATACARVRLCLKYFISLLVHIKSMQPNEYHAPVKPLLC